MRLLQTKSHELFEASDIPVPFPSYAILSHTWISSKDEITYQDMKTRTGDIKNNVYKQMGWSKLKNYCDRASEDGWEWAWMDTCCIDKTNPADTQEAINAMFRWYQRAGVCYAYLDDVDFAKASQMPFPGDTDIARIVNSSRVALRDEFIGAKWFTRGWTLQELLAPHYLMFVDKEWRHMGTRETWALEIEKASNIEARHLNAFKPTDFTSCSIAMRFSWASGRETTVEEDESYSLLGLFGISLPLIYGEGGRQAFNRLQRQLIHVYPDDSVFAWKGSEPDPKPRWGILARSVKDFWDASKVTEGQYGNAYSMTNRGLEITSKCWRQRSNPDGVIVRLNCRIGAASDLENKETGIHLTHDAVADVYYRTRIHELCIGQLDLRDWYEEPSREPLFIRANNYLEPVAPLAMFVVEYPEQVHITATYVATFGHSFTNHGIRPFINLTNETCANGARTKELSVEPKSVLFLNIELEEEGTKLQLDVIISLTENCFPYAGILSRGAQPWERLGDPMEDATGNAMYNALASHIHRTRPSDSTYPLGYATTMGKLHISTNILPKPPRRNAGNGRRSLASREYMLRILVTRLETNMDRYIRPSPFDGNENAAKRQRVS
ncbi:beta transducin [Fusarium pseudocircinatum]|uniref:Beta transducin n=1 Tax=Fusarium pseudocircinatum TaxID=56676 RepID=A0A8H5LFJ5_9HYPO|nr:beta transducin [Fusarium pseudocircinatum]